MSHKSAPGRGFDPRRLARWGVGVNSVSDPNRTNGALAAQTGLYAAAAGKPAFLPRKVSLDRKH